MKRKLPEEVKKEIEEIPKLDETRFLPVSNQGRLRELFRVGCIGGNSRIVRAVWNFMDSASKKNNNNIWEAGFLSSIQNHHSNIVIELWDEFKRHHLDPNPFNDRGFSILKECIKYDEFQAGLFIFRKLYPNNSWSLEDLVGHFPHQWLCLLLEKEFILPRFRFTEVLNWGTSWKLYTAFQAGITIVDLDLQTKDKFDLTICKTLFRQWHYESFSNILANFSIPDSLIEYIADFFVLSTDCI